MIMEKFGGPKALAAALLTNLEVSTHFTLEKSEFSILSLRS
jgi:hypothetical protein